MQIKINLIKMSLDNQVKLPPSSSLAEEIPADRLCNFLLRNFFPDKIDLFLIKNYGFKNA